MNDHRSRDLAHHVDARGRATTTLHLRDDGALRVERFDFGPASDDAFGGDLHHWIDLSADQLPMLAFDLLAAHLHGRLDAVAQLEAICTRLGLPFEKARAR